MKKIILISLLALIPAISSAQVNRISDASNFNITPSGSSSTDTIANITRDLNLGGSGITRPFSVNQGYSPTNITISNVMGTSSSITNGTRYSFVTGAPTNPVYNTTNFLYTCGSPTYAGYSTSYSAPTSGANAVASMYPTDYLLSGTLCIEFIVNANNMEVKYLTTGNDWTMDVDGANVLTAYASPSIAQSGAASSITLSATSSSTNNFYNERYVTLISGTGSGQIKKITDYDGTSKEATIDGSWTTNPDNTSNYVISGNNNTYLANPLTKAATYVKVTFGGERRPHHIRLVGTGFEQIIVDSSGTVIKPAKKQKTKMFYVTDSIGQTGAPATGLAYPYLVAKYLGYDLEASISGGTGIITDAGTKLNYSHRTVPPINSWILLRGAATGGTYTLSQNGTTTGNLNYSATPGEMETALNTAFGAGSFIVRYGTSVPEARRIIIGTGLATSTATMVLNSSMVGYTVTPNISRYEGDITPRLPKDGSGNNLPFVIVVQGSINDLSYSATAQTAFETYFSALKTKFPQAKIIATGQSMDAGPESGSALTLHAAMENASEVLNKINGKTPFVPTFDSSTGVGYLNGTTKITSAAGATGSNTDMYLGPDGVHPTWMGHYYIGDWMSNGIAGILNNE